MVLATRKETREDAVAKLAQKARDRGVRLVQDSDGRHHASIVSQPGRWHYVIGVSCDCQGFATHQRCIPHSALKAALGWDGGTPTPVAITESACRTCRDEGTVQHHHNRWIGGGKLGYRSEWDTIEPCPDCTPPAAA